MQDRPSAQALLGQSLTIKLLARQKAKDDARNNAIRAAERERIAKKFEQLANAFDIIGEAEMAFEFRNSAYFVRSLSDVE